VHQHPPGPGWRADGQRVLGVVLPGARHPARRRHAARAVARQQPGRAQGRLVQHIFCPDPLGQAHSTSGAIFSNFLSGQIFFYFLLIRMYNINIFPTFVWKKQKRMFQE